MVCLMHSKQAVKYTALYSTMSQAFTARLLTFLVFELLYYLINWQRRSIRPRTGTAQMAGLMASTTTKSGSAPPTGKLSRACGMLLVILVGFVKFSGTEVMMFSSKASRAQYVQMKYRRSMRTRQGWQR